MYESNPTPRLLKAAITVVALLLAVGLFLHYRAFAKVRKVKELQAAMANVPPEQRREQFQKMRDAIGQLTPNQRRELGAERQKQFEKRMLDYAKLPREEKNRYLDRQIDRMQAMQQQFANAGNFSAGPRPPSNRSGADGERGRKQRLDQTTPEFRAAMDQFHRDMAQRRQQRGMPPRGPR